jgi:hypothetical protein
VTSEPSIGQYQRLYTHLRDRFANRVVLTFREIEDLLGLPLPEAARLEPEWWAVPDEPSAPSTQSASWTLANRTATVNLSARRVAFDVCPEPPRVRSGRL